jgi:hypothetical protein
MNEQNEQKQDSSADKASSAANVSQRSQYTLTWGIHRGTLISRDTGDPYKFDTEQECIEKAKELDSHFKTIGYKIWYAMITAPDGQRKEIMSNPYY